MRPRTAIRVDFPADLGFQGVIGIEGARERFLVARGPATTPVFEESRRSGLLRFGGWATAGVRPSAAVRLERWSEHRGYLAVSGGTELRTRDNRFGFTATTEHAIALAAHPSYTRASAAATWASSLGLRRAAWSTRLGFEWASTNAPLGTWPVAGGNLSWAIPLRADGLGGLLAGRNTGRAIIHSGLAGDHPITRVGPLILAAGVFLDGARVMAAADNSVGDRFYLDGGAGIRIGIAEGQLGILRIDWARGLLDQRSALTVGVHRSWPAFTKGSR